MFSPEHGNRTTKEGDEQFGYYLAPERCALLTHRVSNQVSLLGPMLPRSHRLSHLSQSLDMRQPPRRPGARPSFPESTVRCPTRQHAAIGLLSSSLKKGAHHAESHSAQDNKKPRDCGAFSETPGLQELRRFPCWCPGEDSNLHGVAPAST